MSPPNGAPFHLFYLLNLWSKNGRSPSLFSVPPETSVAACFSVVLRAFSPAVRFLVFLGCQKSALNVTELNIPGDSFRSADVRHGGGEAVSCSNKLSRQQKYFPLGEAFSSAVTTSSSSSAAVTQTGLRSEVTFSQNAEELMKRGSGSNLKEGGAAATGHQSA